MIQSGGALASFCPSTSRSARRRGLGPCRVRLRVWRVRFVRRVWWFRVRFLVLLVSLFVWLSVKWLMGGGWGA